jgi:hypothetical protein
MNEQELFSNSFYEEQKYLAERELVSFITAVAELYGPEQASLSGKDWLDESELSTNRQWRAVTIAAAARLAGRLSIIPNLAGDPAASTDSTV